jgi:hypothetical protein
MEVEYLMQLLPRLKNTMKYATIDE